MNRIWQGILRIVASLKFNRTKGATVQPMPDQARRLAESRRALYHSRVLLDKVNAQESGVDTLHRSLKQLSEKNGFADLIIRSLGGGA